MSGYANISAVPDQNILYNAASGATLLRNQQNQLLNQYDQQTLPYRVQEEQQKVGNADIEYAARASWALLDPQAYPDEASRAAAYPSLVAEGQRLGFLKNAPSAYPGEATLRRIAAMGTPSEKLGDRAAAGTAIPTPSFAGTGTPAGGGGAPVTPSGTATIGQRQNNPGNLSFAGQPYATQGQGNRFAAFPDMATGVAANVDQIVRNQQYHGKNTVNDMVEYWVSDPKADLTSYKADIAKALGVGINDKIDFTDPRVQQAFIQAQFPHESAGGGFVLNPADVQKGVQMAAARRGQQVQAPPATTVAAAGPGGGVVARNPGAVQVAGPPMAQGPAAAPAAPAAAPAAQPAPTTTTDPETGLPVLSAPPNALAPPAPQPPAPQPPAAAAPSPAPAAPAPRPAANVAAPPAMDGNNLTRQDYADLDRARRSGMTGPQLTQEVQQRQNANVLRQRQYQADVRQAENDAIAQQHQATEEARQAEQLRISQGTQAETQRQHDIQNARAAETAQRAADEAAVKARQAADPIQGTGDKAEADRRLLRYGPKIAAGTAKPDEQLLYATGAQYYLKPQMQWISDPSDPTKQQMVAVPGQMPAGFPHPSYKPGDQPTPPPAAATKSDLKPLPENERKQLLETATRIDQLNEQRTGFKPEYGGFVSAAVGDLANATARNNPIASKADTARAEWWQNYQRMKLAVRQGISGQSLTASELAEFDKADINPGMTPDAIKANLAHQDQILRTAHERRVSSLAADRYSPDAIKAASGIDPATVTQHPLGDKQAAKPEEKPLPPGWKVVVP